jgi:putative nucleotidyltransferase with HDIG domain
MGATIPGWSPEIERGFKEILFRFLEEIQCTRAALYLYGPGDLFLLATQYGFGRRDPLAIEHRVKDPMVARVRELRGVPVAYNHRNELGPLAEYIKTAGNSRLLLVPLIVGDEIIGFVDARDKGRKQSFERPDISRAGKIAAAMVDFARRSGFVVADEEFVPVPEPRVSKPRQAAVGESRPPLLDESGLENLHDAALDCLLDNQVSAVAATLATPEGAATLINTRAGGTEIDRDALCRHQVSALAEAGVQTHDPASWHVEIRRIPAVTDVVTSPMIASAVLLHQPDVGALVGSVISGAGANAARATLARLRARAEDAQEKTTLRFSRRCLARRLLQPGAQKYPDLVAHSEAVSRLAMALAQKLELVPSRVEDAVLAGLLHDVGMRELDYDQTYRSRTPTEEDRARFQKHPVLGEQILIGTGLDEVCTAIRHHHERWDGTGYPDRLTGEAIPFLSRLVHVAEVFDVLSAPGRYRPRVSTVRALEIIDRGKGHQFDPQMVEALVAVVT